MALVFNFKEEYPGIYSLMGVKAINKIVAKIKKTENKPLNTNTFKRDNLSANLSSNVCSFKITNRYLLVSFCFSFTFLVFFLAI